MEIISVAFSLENQSLLHLFSSSFKDSVHFTYTVINYCLVCVRSSSAELFVSSALSSIYLSIYLSLHRAEVNFREI